MSANDVVEDMRAYLTGQYQRVRTGRRDTGFVMGQVPVYGGPPPAGSWSSYDSCFVFTHRLFDV